MHFFDALSLATCYGGVMPITLTKETIDNYEREIEERYKREKEGVQALRELFARLEAGGPESGATPPPVRRVAGRRQTLASKIEEVCSRYKNEEWTTRRMLDYLRSIEFPMKKAKTNNALSTAMANLAKQGKLNIIRKGIGNRGHIYRWQGDAQQAEEASPPADAKEHAAAAEPSQPADSPQQEAAG